MAKEKPLAADVRGNYFIVDSRRLIEEEGLNRREDYGDIEELAKEIKAQGVDALDPLWCYKKGECYVIIRGHRRRRALKILEKDGEIIMVRILLERKGYSKEMRLLDQITENEGKPYTPWEQAKVLRDLRGLGWSQKTIADRSGKSIVYVRRLLSLADAPQKLINLVREGRVSATFAMDQIAEGKSDELVEAGEKIPVTPNQDDIGDLFGLAATSTPPAPGRITRSDVQRPNSLKIFKKWVPAVQEEKLPPEKIELLHWLKRFADGELTLEDFNDYFS